MNGIRNTSRRRRLVTVSVGAAAAIGIAGAVALAADWPGDEDRQQVVRERGTEVMPFDLDATTHRFEPTPDGGVESVVADDPSDREQIRLIQQHLREEAAAFARGDFGDPTQIHGADMPGLSTLEAQAARIVIRYRAKPEGAEVRFATADPVLVTALHDWFAAQSSDHGGHAE